MSRKTFNFHVWGFPVRVDLLFFLLAALLAGGRSNPHYILTWVAVVFVSVLAHELGHAAAGRNFGLNPRIELYTGGGLTWWEYPRNLSPRQEFFITLAGPAVGLAIGAAVWFVVRYAPMHNAPPRLYYVVMGDLLWVNIIWSVLNLMPMLPLDGGKLMRIVVQKVRGPYEEQLPLQISIGCGALLFLLAVSRQMIWGALLSGWFTYRNYQDLQRISA